MPHDRCSIGGVRACMDESEPTQWHYFVASPWPVRIWFGMHLLVGAGIAARLLVSDGPMVTDAHGVFLFIAVVACGALSGFPVGLLTGPFLLGPWMRARGVANGTPYVVGDRVRILVGAYRGQFADVYEVWESRGQVRLKLGPEHRRRVTDVFRDAEVLRAQAGVRVPPDGCG